MALAGDNAESKKQQVRQKRHYAFKTFMMKIYTLPVWSFLRYYYWAKRLIIRLVSAW